jgi:predicted AAA+ superfamily ATPase
LFLKFAVDNRIYQVYIPSVDRDLRTILLHDNPWIENPGNLGPWLASHLPGHFIPRHVLTAAGDRWRETDRAHLVVGPRQAGKSTAIWAHLSFIGEPALFIDCEQSLVQQWCHSAPLFLADLDTVASSPVTLFFEEAQHLENAGLFLKGIVDRGIGAPILVTGSSSFHLGAKVRESLAGRATRERLLPLSLAEVTHDLDDTPGLARVRAVEERFARHLVYGGYPEVWLSDSPETLLTDLVEAIILRDASDLYRIGRPDAFRRLLRLAAGQAGSLVNFSEWASILGVSRDTVASYIEILQAAHVVVRVPPYAGGRRSELTKAPKIFFIDSGIRNQLVHSFRLPADRVDAGATVENWVFGELRKSLPLEMDVHFWRSTSGAEVDFVVDTHQSIVGLEAKAGISGRPSITRSARSFIEAYRPHHFLIVSASAFDPVRIGETEVRWITLEDVASTTRQLVS